MVKVCACGENNPIDALTCRKCGRFLINAEIVEEATKYEEERTEESTSDAPEEGNNLHEYLIKEGYEYLHEIDDGILVSRDNKRFKVSSFCMEDVDLEKLALVAATKKYSIKYFLEGETCNVIVPWYSEENSLKILVNYNEATDTTEILEFLDKSFEEDNFSHGNINLGNLFRIDDEFILGTPWFLNSKNERDLSPENIIDSTSNKEADYFNMGLILLSLKLMDSTLFDTTGKMMICLQKIKSEEITEISSKERILLNGLLIKDLKYRFGSPEVNDFLNNSLDSSSSSQDSFFEGEMFLYPIKFCEREFYSLKKLVEFVLTDPNLWLLFVTEIENGSIEEWLNKNLSKTLYNEIKKLNKKYSAEYVASIIVSFVTDIPFIVMSENTYIKLTKENIVNTLKENIISNGNKYMIIKNIMLNDITLLKYSKNNSEYLNIKEIEVLENTINNLRNQGESEIVIINATNNLINYFLNINNVTFPEGIANESDKIEFVLKNNGIIIIKETIEKLGLDFKMIKNLKGEEYINFANELSVAKLLSKEEVKVLEGECILPNIKALKNSKSVFERLEYIKSISDIEDNLIDKKEYAEIKEAKLCSKDFLNLEKIDIHEYIGIVELLNKEENLFMSKSELLDLKESYVLPEEILNLEKINISEYIDVMSDFKALREEIGLISKPEVNQLKNLHLTHHLIIDKKLTKIPNEITNLLKKLKEVF